MGENMHEIFVKELFYRGIVERKEAGKTCDETILEGICIKEMKKERLVKGLC